MNANSDRGKDLQVRIIVLIEQICKVQGLQATKPIAALAEFIVGFLEEDKEK